MLFPLAILQSLVARQRLALAIPGPAIADSVTDWNAFSLTLIGTAGGPPQQFRVYAMVQIAVHDAFNSINPRFRTYSGRRRLQT